MNKKDIEYLNSKIEDYQTNKNILNSRVITRYFNIGYNNLASKVKSYVNILNEPIISVNKEFEEEKKIIYTAYLVAQCLLYLRDRVPVKGDVIYDEDTELTDEQKKIYKLFARDLLLREKNLESLLNNEIGRGR